MRIKIEVDGDVMAEKAKKSTKKPSPPVAARKSSQVRSQVGIRKLWGKVQWEGDLEESRLGRVQH